MNASEFTSESSPPTHEKMPFNLSIDLDFLQFGNMLNAAVSEVRSAKERLAVVGPIGREILGRYLGNRSPTNILRLLFSEGESVCKSVVEGAVGHKLVQQLLSVGILLGVKDQVRSVGIVYPHAGRCFFADRFADVKCKPPVNQVLMVGPSSITLEKLTPKRSFRSVLDIGTGGGVQAIIAASQAEQVTGTDISARALNFAELNAMINGVRNVQWRCGNLFETVEGAKFELVLVNPPFVISPEMQISWRDGGAYGDQLSWDVVRHAGEHLEEGGFSIVLISWYETAEGETFQRASNLLASSGCDAWIICLHSYDPVSYAAIWLAGSSESEDESPGANLDRWTDYYNSLGARSLHVGAAVMRRRRSDSNWVRFEDFGSSFKLDCVGDQIESVFAGEDLLASMDVPSRVLDMCFTPHPKLDVERYQRIVHRKWCTLNSECIVRQGIEMRTSLGAFEADLISRLNSRDTPRQLLYTCRSEHEITLAEAEVRCISLLTTLLRAGQISVTGED